MTLNKLLAKHLREFAALVDTINVESGVVFRRLLNVAFDHYGVDRNKMIVHFKVSKGAISRWCSGNNSPHPMMRPVIAAWIKEEVLKLALTLN